MEQKLVRVPFDVEMAKKITNGEVKGKIITRDGRCARIVCWDMKNKTFPIVALVEGSDKVEESSSFTINGMFNSEIKGLSDLMLEIPEYMAFKDGDILTYHKNENRGSIFVYRKRDSDMLANYVELNFNERGNNILKFDRSYYTSTLCKVATNEEMEFLIEALKQSKDERAPKYLKRFFNIETEEHVFKPFDKVLVRQSTSSPWECAFFSNYTDQIHKYRCQGMNYMYCIPYEGNEHLVNTKIGDDEE